MHVPEEMTIHSLGIMGTGARKKERGRESKTSLPSPPTNFPSSPEGEGGRFLSAHDQSLFFPPQGSSQDPSPLLRCGDEGKGDKHIGGDLSVTHSR